MNYQDITDLLGSESESLMTHSCSKISKDHIYKPSGSQISDIFSHSNRSDKVVESLTRLYQHGRLGGTGYLSIFPVDQGMEHTAAYSFVDNPLYFDPESIVSMALEGECSAVVSTSGVLALVSRKYAREIPFIVKLNHSEHLTLPPETNQIMFSSVQQAYDMGAIGVGATVYFGSEFSHQLIASISEAFEEAHRLGLFTVLWCYPRNENYVREGVDYTTAVDITAQANHIAVTMGADIIKQKFPSAVHGFESLGFSKYNKKMYSDLLTDNEIDLIRYQVAHCYMGKISLINSGGEASGKNDFHDAIRTAVINKRGGGAGLIMGRKVFKHAWEEGLKILRSVQDVYLEEKITVA